MRIFKFNDQDGEKIVTEEDIRREYFPYWKEQMVKAGKESDDFELCLEDYLVVNWAWLVKQDSY